MNKSINQPNQYQNTRACQSFSIECSLAFPLTTKVRALDSVHAESIQMLVGIRGCFSLLVFFSFSKSNRMKRRSWQRSDTGWNAVLLHQGQPTKQMNHLTKLPQRRQVRPTDVVPHLVAPWFLLPLFSPVFGGIGGGSWQHTEIGVGIHRKGEQVRLFLNGKHEKSRPLKIHVFGNCTI